MDKKIDLLVLTKLAENLCKKYKYLMKLTFVDGNYVLELYYRNSQVACFSSHKETIDEVYTSAVEFLQHFDDLSTCEDWKLSNKLEGKFENEMLENFKNRYKDLLVDAALLKQIEDNWKRIGIGLSDNFEMAMVRVLNKLWKINNVKEVEFDEEFALYNRYKNIQLVEVNPCATEYENKSFIGLYLGDFPQSVCGSYEEDKFIIKPTRSNPLIYIPDTNTVVFGSNSFWRKVEKIEDFKGISKEDIENTWYIKLLKDIRSEK